MWLAFATARTLDTLYGERGGTATLRRDRVAADREDESETPHIGSFRVHE
jgi:hypothetical protein